MPQVLDKYRHLHFHGIKSGQAAASASERIGQARLSPFRRTARSSRENPVIPMESRLLLEEICRLANLNLAAYRPAALARRVPACLRALQVLTPAEALQRLYHDPHALQVA